MLRALTITALTVFPFAVSAGCEGELLFSCTFREGAKTVETCLNDTQATYRYGPTNGNAELEMARDVLDVDMLPWTGFGRWISESFTFSNGAYRYTMRYAIDRLSEDQLIEGDLLVAKEDQTLAELICDPGSVKTSGYPLPLFDIKQSLGQVWDHENYEWRIAN